MSLKQQTSSFRNYLPFVSAPFITHTCHSEGNQKRIAFFMEMQAVKNESNQATTCMF